MQRWQFAPEYLAEYGEESKWDIVPTDSPLSFDNVHDSAWYADHPLRKGKWAASEESSEDEQATG